MRYYKRFTGYLLPVIVFSLFACMGCKKFEKEGSISRPGVVLTFDDDRVENWSQYLPFLDSAGIKATFYVSRYHCMSPQKKNQLAIIRNHGHEIAYHTANHLNMMDYVYRYKHPIEELIRKEIEPDLKMMRRDGFNPVTFAYPYGAHNPLLDKALSKYFKSVRALNGSLDFTKSLVSGINNAVLYGLGIDKGSNRSNADINKVLTSARNNSTIAVFVAHDINTGGKLSVSVATLKMIARFVKANNLTYYTASEISQ